MCHSITQIIYNFDNTRYQISNILFFLLKTKYESWNFSKKKKNLNHSHNKKHLKMLEKRALSFELNKRDISLAELVRGKLTAACQRWHGWVFEGRFGFNTSVSCGKPPRIALTSWIQPDIPDRWQQTHNHNLTSVNWYFHWRWKQAGVCHSADIFNSSRPNWAEALLCLMSQIFK